MGLLWLQWDPPHICEIKLYCVSYSMFGNYKVCSKNAFSETEFVLYLCLVFQGSIACRANFENDQVSVKRLF